MELPAQRVEAVERSLTRLGTFQRPNDQLVLRAVAARVPVTLPPIDQLFDISAIQIGPSTRQVARCVLTAKNRQERQQQRIAREGLNERAAVQLRLESRGQFSRVARTLTFGDDLEPLVDETIHIDGGQWKQLEMRQRLEPGTLITGWSRRARTRTCR